MKKAFFLLVAILMVFGMTACNDAGEAGADFQDGFSAISRTELVDEADVKIVALSFAQETMVGPELKLQIENNTDKKLVFQSCNTSVNRYVVSSVMSVEVEAGEKEKCSMILSKTDMQNCGITTVASMELAFRIFEASNWKQYLNTAPVTLETTAAKGFTYTFQHEGVTIHADNGVKILAKEPVKQGGAQVYIHNGSEVAVAVQTVNCTVNGIEIDPQFYEEVPVGKHLVAEIIFMEEVLEENGITEVSDMEVTFEILDVDTGETIAQTQAVKVSAK